MKLIKAAWAGLMRKPPAEFSRTQNLLMRARWAVMYYDDAVPSDASDRWYEPSEWAEKAIRWVCTKLNAHEPEDDQCMRPAHRYCLICEAATPYRETRRVTW